MPEEHSIAGGTSPDIQDVHDNATGAGWEPSERWGTSKRSDDATAPESTAADIHALYDQLPAPAKVWFLEQLRRGARGEPTFLNDPEQAFGAWIAQPVLNMPVPEVRVPNTIAVEDQISEARRRLQAVGCAVDGMGHDASCGVGFIIGDIVDILQDAGDTLADMRREGGAA